MVFARDRLCIAGRRLRFADRLQRFHQRNLAVRGARHIKPPTLQYNPRHLGRLTGQVGFAFIDMDRIQSEERRFIGSAGQPHLADIQTQSLHAGLGLRPASFRFGIKGQLDIAHIGHQRFAETCVGKPHAQTIHCETGQIDTPWRTGFGSGHCFFW